MQAAAARTVTSKLTVAVYFAVVLLPVILLGYDGPLVRPRGYLDP